MFAFIVLLIVTHVTFVTSLQAVGEMVATNLGTLHICVDFQVLGYVSFTSNKCLMFLEFNRKISNLNFVQMPSCPKQV